MVGYINTVDFAAWHIPCYNTHNCPSSRNFAGSSSGSSGGSGGGGAVQSGPDYAVAGAGGSLGADFIAGESPSGDAAVLGATMFILLMASLLGGVVVAAAAFSRKGYRRPLNTFILSLLTSDWLIVLTAFPMQVRCRAPDRSIMYYVQYICTSKVVNPTFSWEGFFQSAYYWWDPGS